MADVVVVGGGIVGSAVAFELAAAGVSVTLLDAGAPGNASDAGAGILSPATTWRTEPRWVEFAAAAGEHLPNLVERLGELGTSDPGWSRPGLFTVSLEEGDEPWWEELAAAASGRAPGVVSEVTVEEAKAQVPVLGDIRRALWNPAAARVDGRLLVAALQDGARRLGAEIIAERAVGLERHGDRVTGVVTEGSGLLGAGEVVVAGGAWSSRLVPGVRIRPVKGQIVHLAVHDPRLDPGSWPIVQPVFGHYLVSWPDRRVACGGTFEEDAEGEWPSPHPTALGLRELLRECHKLAPGLGTAEPLEVRVGFRPFAADDLPVVGPVPGLECCSIASGHGADGLLAGPLSGALLARRILGGDEGDLGLFDPARFA